MTDNPDLYTGQARLTDASLWLLGTPAAILDGLYLAYGAPPLRPQAPETVVVWALGAAAMILLAWSLLSSACAHLAALRTAPAPLRRLAHRLVARFGTRLSKSLLARAGASAIVGSALVAATPIGAALATPREPASPAVSLTWADAPASRPGADAPGTTASAASDSDTRTPQAPPGAAHASPDPPTTITVAPGDTLWSIASALRPEADDAHITRTWQAIHRANADTISNPSLIYPGARLTIPQDLP